MKLPTIDTYAFPVKVPSSGKIINVRPYLVREEKLLLMAQESENYDEQIEAIAQVIRNCTNDEINPRVAPYFDIEYFLLQLRSRSVGEVVTPVYVCHNKPTAAITECGHKTSVEINLTEINVTNLDKPDENFILRLSDQYTLHLRYPTVYTIHKLVATALNEGQIGSQPFLESLCDVFDRLEDHTNKKMFDFNEYTTDEKMQFLESLSTRNYEELIEFLDNLPTVEKEIKFTCSACQFEHRLLLSGVTDFLG